MAAVVPLRGVNLLGEGEILLHLPVERSVDLLPEFCVYLLFCTEVVDELLEFTKCLQIAGKESRILSLGLDPCLEAARRRSETRAADSGRRSSAPQIRSE